MDSRLKNSDYLLQEKCLILEAIRTVEERCHAKESCTLQAAPDILARGLRDPCPGVRYSTVQYSTVQYSTVQYSAVQYSTVQ